MIRLRTLVAFLRRDFLIESSYKLSFLFQLLASLFPVFSFYFVSHLVDASETPALKQYGVSYFDFVLVGIAFTQYFTAALRTFADSVRRAQLTGVFEAMLSTRTSSETLILCSAAYSYAMASLHVIVVFAVGALVGVDFSKLNPWSTLLTLFFTVITFTALGILSASAIVALKKGDPIEVLVASLSTLLGGALFPVELLPAGLRELASLLPITHSLEALRLSVFAGTSISELRQPIGTLAVMAVVLVPASIYAFRYTIEKGRRDGTLVHY